MREIKFRAWHKIEKRYYYFDLRTVTRTRYGGYWNPTDNSKDCELDDPNLYEEVEWATGLKDKNGKEIYEGDILLSISGYTNLQTGEPTGEIARSTHQVIFLGEGGRFGLKRISGRGTKGYIDPFAMSQDIIAKYHEVIGNIYENPELVEDKP